MHSASSRRRANRTRCRLTNCIKFAQTRGLCKAHGGGSRCRHLECNKLAQSRGLCIAHGGGRRCTVEDCNKLAQSKGHCISHGGGRRCAVPHCDKFAQVRGYCKAHAKVLMVFRSPLSPTHAALMTPPASTLSSPMITLSPVKSKLSIDFLVNPSLPRSVSSETKRPIMLTTQNPMATAQPNLNYPRKIFNQQPSLLSFLEHGSSTSTSAVSRSQLAELKLSPIVFPPLVLYRSASKVGFGIVYTDADAPQRDLKSRTWDATTRRSPRVVFIQHKQTSAECRDRCSAGTKTAFLDGDFAADMSNNASIKSSLSTRNRYRHRQTYAARWLERAAFSLHCFRCATQLRFETSRFVNVYWQVLLSWQSAITLFKTPAFEVHNECMFYDTHFGFTSLQPAELLRGFARSIVASDHRRGGLFASSQSSSIYRIARRHEHRKLLSRVFEAAWRRFTA